MHACLIKIMEPSQVLLSKSLSAQPDNANKIIYSRSSQVPQDAFSAYELPSPASMLNLGNVTIESSFP